MKKIFRKLTVWMIAAIMLITLTQYFVFTANAESGTGTVTFYSNNGTGDTASKTVDIGDSFELTDAGFTYGKCEVEYWTTEADGSGYFYNIGDNLTVTEDMSLYAQWVLPLYKYDSFSDGDYGWVVGTESPHRFSMKNGAVLYASVVFPSKTNDDEVVFTVEGDCELKGSVSFVSGTGMSGSNQRGKLTVKGDGTLKFYKMISTGVGDTLVIETDTTVVSNYLFLGASGGSDSKIIVKDATLTLHDITLLQYLIMEGKARLNILNGVASFHSAPEISLSDMSQIFIEGDGYGCVFYKEGEDNNQAFDTLITNKWLPEGYSFKKENYGYYLYDISGSLELDSITIKKPGHTVTFVDWDGSEIDKQAVDYGYSAVAPADPAREGWLFTGWDKTFNEVTSDLTVTAQYVENEEKEPTRFLITFDADDGKAVSNVYVTDGSSLDEPTVPTRDGYNFEGWYSDQALTVPYDFETKVRKSFTLYAKWSKIPGEDNDKQEITGHDCPSLRFSDLDITQWYHYDTDYVIDKGIFKGTTKTKFTPYGNITRAMMITVLYRAEGEPEVTGKSTFEDIDENAYYAKAVVWGQQNGIIKGYSDSEYAPNQDILREQIAAIMYRYAKYKGYDVSAGEKTTIFSYDDFGSISNYAVPAMQWAVGSGMIIGETESTLEPEGFAKRVEIAAMLHRFIEAN